MIVLVSLIVLIRGFPRFFRMVHPIPTLPFIQGMIFALVSMVRV